MAPVTEIVYLPLPEGKDPADPASGLRPVLDKSFATILSQPGAQRLFYAQQKENPTIATLFIDWDSVEDHHKFMAADYYKPFMEEVLSLAAGPPSLHHVKFEPHPPSDGLKLGGATEVLSVYFPANYSTDDMKTFDTNIKAFAEIVKDTSPDAKAIVGGWGVEEVDIPDTDEKGIVYVAFVAWTSVQKHLEYRETQAFKDSIHLLRGAKDLKGVKVFHVSTEEVLKK